MPPAWSETAIPDLTGMTAVVNGASGGIGLQVARGLASKRAQVVLGVRPPRPRRTGVPDPAGRSR
jgi:NAD(P)-dependent dehydrogenase (short-subunit alcohol dehydrogenase family)